MRTSNGRRGLVTISRRARVWWEERVVRRLALAALVRRTGNFSDVRWMGQPIWQNIADVWALQEAINDLQIDLVVECGTNRGGLAYFLACLFDLRGTGRVITIDIESLSEVTHDRVEFLHGSSTDPEIVANVHKRVAEIGSPNVLVLLDSDHAADHVLSELRAYADLVPVGGYVVVQDGIIDELRVFRAGRPGPRRAIEGFIARDDRFEVDTRRSTRFLFNHSPSGWLRRVR